MRFNPTKAFAGASICSLVCGFVCTILCLLAGVQPGFMDSFAMVTFEPSAPKAGVLRQSAPQQRSDPLSKMTNEVIEAPSQIHVTAGQMIDSAMQKFDIPDFYDLHVASVCEGNYTPENGRPAYAKSVQSCFRISSDYSHVIDRIPQLGKLDWPPEGAGMNFASMLLATIALYCALVFVVAFTVFFETTSLVSTARQVYSCSSIFNILAAILAFVVSTLTTVANHAVVTGVRKYGGRGVIEASTGTPFLILNWVSFIFIMLGNVFWCLASRGELSVLGRLCS